MGCLERPKDRILFCMTLVYLFSFTSLYIQLPGLFSRKGILPVDKLGINDATTPNEFIAQPNLIRLAHFIGLDKYDALEIICVIGAIFSLLAFIFESSRSISTFIILWIAHYACYSSGQVFTHFHWDLLLLEAGFLTILLARGDLILFSLPKYAPSDKIAICLFKWLLFRVLFSSGMAKLISLCPSWWGLDAYTFHFETQPMPAPLAYFAHHLPLWILKLVAVFTLYVEIIVPVMFFLPIKGLRLFSFYSQVLLQLANILTGNQGFTSILIIALCYSLLTDSDFKAKRPEPLPKKTIQKKKKQTPQAPLAEDGCGCVYMTVAGHILSLVLIAASLALTVQLFGIKHAGSTISSKIMFDEKVLNQFLLHTVAFSCYATIAYFLIAVYVALKSSLVSDGVLKKLYFSLGTILVTLIGAALLFSSIHVFAGSLAPAVTKSQPAAFGLVSKQLMPYSITNSYSHSQKISQMRHEVSLEVSESDKGPWTKMGLEKGALSHVAPHQPRLESQLSLAAKSKADSNPWIYSLMHGVLEGRAEVLGLLQVDAKSFKNPKFVRATLQQYKFQPMSTVSWPQKWWTLSGKPTEYIPALGLNSEALKKKLQELKLVGTKVTAPSKNNQVTAAIKMMRDRVGQPRSLLPFLAMLVLIMLTKFRMSS